MDTIPSRDFYQPLLHSGSALRDDHHISLGPEEYGQGALDLLLMAGTLTVSLSKLSFFICVQVLNHNILKQLGRGV